MKILKNSCQYQQEGVLDKQPKFPPLFWGCVIYYVICLVFIAIISLLSFGFLYKPSPFDKPTTIIIEPGQSLIQIAESLHKNGLVAHPKLFCLGVKLFKDYRHLNNGEYLFQPHSSPAMMVDLMVKGEVVVHKVTLPEGLTNAEMIEIVSKNDVLKGEVVKVYPEGLLLPSTYFFNYGQTRQKIVDIMYQQNQKKLQELWNARSTTNFQLTTIEDAVVLASIVEKEAMAEEEKPIIARVFMNRLKRKMLLQADPTIIYDITNGKSRLGRALSKKDLQKKSPYNTYLVKGLPPTPIANPSIGSLKAVLQNQSVVNYLYFVADGNGRHKFSATLPQHNKHVASYYRSRKTQ